MKVIGKRTLTVKPANSICLGVRAIPYARKEGYCWSANRHGMKASGFISFINKTNSSNNSKGKNLTSHSSELFASHTLSDDNDPPIRGLGSFSTLHGLALRQSHTPAEPFVPNLLSPPLCSKGNYISPLAATSLLRLHLCQKIWPVFRIRIQSLQGHLLKVFAMIFDDTLIFVGITAYDTVIRSKLFNDKKNLDYFLIELNRKE